MTAEMLASTPTWESGCHLKRWCSNRFGTKGSQVQILSPRLTKPPPRNGKPAAAGVLFWPQGTGASVAGYSPGYRFAVPCVHAACAAQGVSDTPIRTARRAAGLTQAQLAAHVGVSGSWIGAVDSGHAPLPTHLAHRIAVVLGVPVALLLPGSVLAPTDTFHCARLHCTLAVGACIARQLRSRNLTPHSDTQRKRGRAACFPSCTACQQGRAVCAAVTRCPALPPSRSAPPQPCSEG